MANPVDPWSLEPPKPEVPAPAEPQDPWAAGPPAPPQFLRFQQPPALRPQLAPSQPVEAQPPQDIAPLARALPAQQLEALRSPRIPAPTGGGFRTQSGRLDDLGKQRAANVEKTQQAYDQQLAAMERADRARQNAEIDQDIALEQKSMVLEEQSRLDQETHRAAQERVDAAAQRLEDFRTSSRGVDPGRVFKNVGTLGTIGAWIGAGLGSFGAALTGGRNDALAIIENAIDRDIDAQKDAFDRKERGLQGAYSAAVGKSQSEMEARAMAKTAALDVVSSQLEKVQASMQGSAAAQNAADMLGRVQQLKLQTQQQYLDGEYNDIRNQIAQAQRAASAGVAQQRADQIKLAEIQAKAQAEQGRAMRSGLALPAGMDDDARKKAQEQYAAYNAAIEKYDRMAQEAKDAGNDWVGEAGKRKWQGWIDDAAEVRSRATGQGTYGLDQRVAEKERWLLPSNFNAGTGDEESTQFARQAAELARDRDEFVRSLGGVTLDGRVTKHNAVNATEHE